MLEFKLLEYNEIDVTEVPVTNIPEGNIDVIFSNVKSGVDDVLIQEEQKSDNKDLPSQLVIETSIKEIQKLEEQMKNYRDGDDAYILKQGTQAFLQKLKELRDITKVERKKRDLLEQAYGVDSCWKGGGNPLKYGNFFNIIGGVHKQFIGKVKTYVDHENGATISLTYHSPSIVEVGSLGAIGKSGGLLKAAIEFIKLYRTSDELQTIFVVHRTCTDRNDYGEFTQDMHKNVGSGYLKGSQGVNLLLSRVPEFGTNSGYKYQVVDGGINENGQKINGIEVLLIKVHNKIERQREIIEILQSSVLHIYDHGDREYARKLLKNLYGISVNVCNDVEALGKPLDELFFRMTTDHSPLRNDKVDVIVEESKVAGYPISMIETKMSFEKSPSSIFYVDIFDNSHIQLQKYLSAQGYNLVGLFPKVGTICGMWQKITNTHVFPPMVNEARIKQDASLLTVMERLRETNYGENDGGIKIDRENNNEII